MKLMFCISVAALLLIASGCGNEPPQGHTHAHGHDHDHPHPHPHGHDHSHDHAHPHTPHHGIAVPFMANDQFVGIAELKLHDDKGDLELWLTTDASAQTPFDLPLDATVTVSFPQLEGKSVTLQKRNAETNEDEDGIANIRDGQTNYFIFPGETGADASFLLGKEFSSEAVISFSGPSGVEYTTKPFILKPHTH